MRKFLILIFCFSSILGQSQTKKVLFIGNSYTLENNLAQITASIASSVGDKIIFSTSAIPNYSLQLHSTNSTSLSLIRQGGWDYVVLQEYSQYPSEPLSWVESNVYPYARYLDNEINTYNSGAETIFYMTWGRKDGDASRCSKLPAVCTYIGMDDLTRERYMYMAQTNQAIVSPVGAVWRYIRENYPAIELYQADGSHPSAAGSYAAACCFYTAIFRKDPGLATYNFTIDPADASKIRAATKQVVFNNLKTWYIGVYDNKFTIAVNAGSGGSIKPSSSFTVIPGTNATFTITPNSGYRISEVFVDNVSVGAVSSYTFSNITRNHSISVTFIQLTSIISTNAGTGGVISPKGTLTVNYGTNSSFSVTPEKGYRIADVVVDKVSVGAISSYTFYNITSNHTISAFFTPLTFSIASSSGKNGHINPSGLVTISWGVDQTYTFTPDRGYQIAEVLVDNASVGVTPNYTFRNVTSDHSVSVRFLPLIYTITGISGSGGSISPEGEAKVNYGEGLTYTLIPEYGYKISDLIVDNHPVNITSNEFSFYNVTQNHSISATFSKLITYVIETGYFKNGSISPSGDTIVPGGSDLSYTLNPDPGYRIANVFIDTIPVGPVSEYTFKNISADHSISATFSSSVVPEMYPNPFRQGFSLNIRSPYDYQYEICIITLGNRVVYQNKEVPANTTITLTPEISPGFYILNVYYKGIKAAVARIVKD